MDKAELTSFQVEVTTLGRFSDDEIPASAEVVPEIRLFFARWAGELSRD